MKKIVYACAAMVAAVSIASADFTRLELGGGVWQQTPKEYIDRRDNDGALKLNGKYLSGKKKSGENYLWINLKHPLPIIPNLRLEYVSLSDKGGTSGTVNGQAISTSAPTTFDIQQYDIIPYYNLLDNTFWITLDLGLDAKVAQTKVAVGSVGTFNGYEAKEMVVIPLIYVRARAELPLNIGVEGDIKAVTYSGYTVYDVRAKIDYTLDFVPVVKPAVKPVKKPTTKAATKPKVSKTPKSTVSGKYYVQVGSFKENPSTRFLSVIKSSGFKYHVTKPDRTGYKKLLIGPYKTRAEVDKARDVIRDRIHKSAFVVQK